MTTRPHFADLSRRYREADWVSEFQRLWAIFNYWLSAHTGKQKDRDCIEALKADSDLEAWVARVLSASEYKRPHNVSEGYGGSHPRFTADNVISVFFRAAHRSLVLEPRINWPWRVGADQHVRETNAIVLDEIQFRAAYVAHAEALGSFQGMGHSATLHEILVPLGVSSTGCCFFRRTSPAQVSADANALAKITLPYLRSDNSLVELIHLTDSQSPTELSSDVVETLYNLRNVAIHGSLDFLLDTENAAARAGYDLLDSLIRDIRDHW